LRDLGREVEKWRTDTPDALIIPPAETRQLVRAVLFLAFEARFATGAELPVDGGLAQVDSPL
jgi:NAD(P)-dependent dehydrogenase (short-subunit alcohol dehydrogenase family)